MSQREVGETGFTLVELTVSVVILSLIIIGFSGLFVSLIHSTVLAKRQAIAVTLATNQMEYLRSLPYSNLAVQGGSIYATSLLPATTTQTENNIKFTVKTSIDYIDDAYDGCGQYPNLTLEKEYCRNYPPPSGAPATDLNPADYKIIHVSVTDNTGSTLASQDTEVAPSVAETASNTGALFVKVIDGSGNPVSGATVGVTDSKVAPTVNVSDSTDGNGEAIFYGLPPDSGTNYVINASQSSYSSLSTIAPSGSLQPTYANQTIISQKSSSVTLVIAPQGANSLLIQATDTSGNPLSGIKIYTKGGYKNYTSVTDYSYYFDNYYSNYDGNTVSDSRPTTDASGYTTISNLPPVNSYLFCNSDANSSTTNCTAGGTKYYLAAAIPYGGTDSLMPIVVPTYNAASPPSTTFSYGGNAYLQEVQLMLTTSSSFPRVYDINPDGVSLGGGNLSSFPVIITGYNLSTASAKLIEGSKTYTGSGCSNSATQMTCNFNFTGAIAGTAQLVVTNSSGTLSLPFSPQLGGFNVTP